MSEARVNLAGRADLLERGSPANVKRKLLTKRVCIVSKLGIDRAGIVWQGEDVEGNHAPENQSKP